MANRYPLIVNSGSSQIQELASGDNLDLTGSQIVNATFTSAREKAIVTPTAATGTIQYDISTQTILYYTANATGNFTINIRGDSSNSLNSVMSTGDTITATFINTNGSSAYYLTAVTIDGTSVTPKYQNGLAPASGNANSLDIYNLTIIKTASATYTCILGTVKFS